MEKATKICPYCGEEILAVAKKCKHCGEWLDGNKPSGAIQQTGNTPGNANQTDGVPASKNYWPYIIVTVVIAVGIFWIISKSGSHSSSTYSSDCDSTEVATEEVWEEAVPDDYYYY